LLEERDGGLFAFEFKWKAGKAKVPKTFITAYPEARFEVINKDNFLELLI
jgi:hypothetical protein